MNKKKKSEFIKTVEESSLFVSIAILLISILLFGGALFGIVFPRAFLAYLIIFTIGSWLLILSVVVYIISKFIGWIQEGKHEKSLIMMFFIIGVLIYLSTTGLLTKGIDFVDSLAYSPSELFGNQKAHENLSTSTIETCDFGSIKCKDKCYTECESGRIFVCDPEQGGTCQYNVTKCEEIGKHSCKGTCWETCPTGSQFICDDVKGGVCKQY